jgi:hypothetical protein
MISNQPKNSVYICLTCASNHPRTLPARSYLITGEHYAGDYKTRKQLEHTSGNSAKAVNGVFTLPVNQVVDALQSSGFYELETGGGINAYYDFDSQIADVMFSGEYAGSTTLAKFVLLNSPEYAHPYGATGCQALFGHCSMCGKQVFDHITRQPFCLAQGY